MDDFMIDVTFDVGGEVRWYEIWRNGEPIPGTDMDRDQLLQLRDEIDRMLG